MAGVVLFHSALGLRPGVVSAADRLRASGHEVYVPDYYDGETFEEMDDGLGDALGMEEVLRRGREAVADLPAGLVYAGFSLGAMPAELLAATRPGARAAILMHSAIPVEEFAGFGAHGWPEGLPAQVHCATGDPWVEREEVDGFRRDVERAGGAFEEHTYPGSAHLFSDPDLPDYDRASSEEMWRRVLAFLERL